jgi:hypothetical protein
MRQLREMIGLESWGMNVFLRAVVLLVLIRSGGLSDALGQSPSTVDGAGEPPPLEHLHLGPLFQAGQAGNVKFFDLAPFWVSTHDMGADATEQNILYPLFTRNRFGEHSRSQLLQFLNMTETANDPEKPESPEDPKGVTLFPVFFYKQPTNTTDGYWALVPIYGNLENRLFKKQIHFVLFPIYAHTEKKDFQTWNFLYPVFHVRRGDQLRGWGIWPLAGYESRDQRQVINSWEEVEEVDGYHKGFALWPFIFWSGREDESGPFERDVAVLPLFRALRSEDRDSTTIGWPFFTYTEDRKEEYRELGAPWPLIVFARGEGKTMNRVWPFYSNGTKGSARSSFVMWPFFIRRETDSNPLYRRRDRILYFLYSDTVVRNTGTGDETRRRAMWPLFRSYRDQQGVREFSTLALLEPFFQVDEELRRTWGPLWTLYRSRSDEDGSHRKWSTFLNLLHGRKNSDESSWKFGYGLMSRRTTEDQDVWKFLSIPVWKKDKSDSTD